MIESNRFSEYETSVQLLGFPATTGSHCSKRAASTSFFGLALRRFFDVGRVVVDSGEAREDVVEAGVEGRADENGDGNDVKPEEESNGGRQWAVDRRTPDRLAEDVPLQHAAADPHGHGDRGAGQIGSPARTRRNRQVEQRGQHAYRTEQHDRPVQVPDGHQTER